RRTVRHVRLIQNRGLHLQPCLSLFSLASLIKQDKYELVQTASNQAKGKKKKKQVLMTCCEDRKLAMSLFNVDKISCESKCCARLCPRSAHACCPRAEARCRKSQYTAEFVTLKFARAADAPVALSTSGFQTIIAGTSRPKAVLCPNTSFEWVAAGTAAF